MNRRDFQRIVAASLAIAANPAAWAQRGPAKIYVGFPAGGLPDLVARAVAEQFKRSLDLITVVENRPGANGRIAGQAVKNAAPDGNTLLVAPASGMVHLPHIYTDLGFDPMVDLTPVAQLCENDFALAVNAKLPVRNLKEFALWCEQNPAKATFGSPGSGSSPHMMGMQISRAVNVPFTHVPYKGANLALPDLIGGHITAMVAATILFLQPEKAGSVRILATTGRVRSTVLPQVPTFQELGLRQLTLTEGTWLMAPGKTPAPVVERIAAAALESVKGREMQNILDGLTVAAPLGPKELGRLMREEFDRRGAAIRAMGFKAEE